MLVEEEVEEVVESRVSLPMEAGRTTSMPRYSLPVTMARCSSHWMSYSSLVALVMYRHTENGSKLPSMYLYGGGRYKHTV